MRNQRNQLQNRAKVELSPNEVAFAREKRLSRGIPGDSSGWLLGPRSVAQLPSQRATGVRRREGVQRREWSCAYLIFVATASVPAPAIEILETVQSLTLVDKIACERISSVIRSLRTYSRADESDLRRVDLHEILRNTLKLSACEYRGRIAVETDFGELPQVECYPHLLSQVFLNVMINAGQAVEAEGRVQVKTRLEGDRVRIDISDTGKGIGLEDRPQIFTAGFTTKPPGLGTGLGLSISRQIVVETHGGEMDFTSEVGAGTTFSIRIPLKQREAACC